jgi:hypothetical protein
MAENTSYSNAFSDSQDRIAQQREEEQRARVIAQQEQLEHSRTLAQEEQREREQREREQAIAQRRQEERLENSRTLAQQEQREQATAQQKQQARVDPQYSYSTAQQHAKTLAEQREQTLRNYKLKVEKLDKNGRGTGEYEWAADAHIRMNDPNDPGAQAVQNYTTWLEEANKAVETARTERDAERQRSVDAAEYRKAREEGKKAIAQKERAKLTRQFDTANPPTAEELTALDQDIKAAREALPGGANDDMGGWIKQRAQQREHEKNGTQGIDDFAPEEGATTTEYQGKQFTKQEDGSWAAEDGTKISADGKTLTPAPASETETEEQSKGTEDDSETETEEQPKGIKDDAVFGDPTQPISGRSIAQSLFGAKEEAPEMNALREREAAQATTEAQMRVAQQRAEGIAKSNVARQAGEWTEASANQAANVAATAQGGDTGGGAAIARMAAAQHARDTEGAQNLQRAQQRVDTYEQQIGARAQDVDKANQFRTDTRLQGTRAQQQYNDLRNRNRAAERLADMGDRNNNAGPTTQEMNKTGTDATANPEVINNTITQGQQFQNDVAQAQQPTSQSQRSETAANPDQAQSTPVNDASQVDGRTNTAVQTGSGAGNVQPGQTGASLTEEQSKQDAQGERADLDAAADFAKTDIQRSGLSAQDVTRIFGVGDDPNFWTNLAKAKLVTNDGLSTTAGTAQNTAGSNLNQRILDAVSRKPPDPNEIERLKGEIRSGAAKYDQQRAGA